MDTIVFLSRPLNENGVPDDTAIKLEFRKARLRNPSNADQFEPLIVRPGSEWSVETAPKGASKRNVGDSMTRLIRTEYLAAHARLSDGLRKYLDEKEVARSGRSSKAERPNGDAGVMPPARPAKAPKVIPFKGWRETDPDYKPPDKSNDLPPPPDREALSLASWLKRDIPARDHLLGGVMCTTSRWFIFGETGIGKTMLGMDLGGAVAAAMAFLNWAGQRKACVMYVDGELPQETFKERMQLIARRYSDDIQFYGYNREDLGDDGMPPLNTEAGQNWLRREIDVIKPDLIIFDSIMCLVVGSMSEEATWIPMRPFVRELTRRHIAQVWLHHANDSGTQKWQGLRWQARFQGLGRRYQR